MTLAMPNETTDPVITINEFLELEKCAIEKFPYKFEKCFYSQGYVRQPLYVCFDCFDFKASGGRPSAFCYSCSIACHVSHRVVEIGHKRAYRCECGTSAYTSECKIAPEDKDMTILDAENFKSIKFPRTLHNFEGRFCACDKEYVEPEDAEEIAECNVHDENQNKPDKNEESSLDAESNPKNECENGASECGVTMLQCVLCEDWYHSQCIQPVPHETQFEDYFCFECILQSEFLKHHAFDLDIKILGEKQTKICLKTRAKSENLDQNAEMPFKNGIFCFQNWRDFVCNCEECAEGIAKDPISIIIQNEDAEWTPELEFNENADEEVDSASASFSSLSSSGNASHSAVLEGIYACNDLGQKLKRYLEPFAAADKVVQKEDILEFFKKEAKKTKR